jgi:hypothetical protein
MCQYAYLCTSKASKLSTDAAPRRRVGGGWSCARLRRDSGQLSASRCQYAYFCTSKASKLSTCALVEGGAARACGEIQVHDMIVAIYIYI